MISDKGSTFVSQVIRKVAYVLGITLEYATTKHAQAISMLEAILVSIKKALKIETGERQSMWHKKVNTAVLNYNTSYHTSFGCEPSRVFHEHVPHSFLDIKLGICSQKLTIPNSENAQDVLAQIEILFQGVGKNAMQAYIKHKIYYGKKNKRF